VDLQGQDKARWFGAMSDWPHPRPPSYLSRATLAHELDCAESTVDELVKRGVLPKPVRLSSGCVRWCWAEVELAITSLKDGVVGGENDPFLAGVRNATKID
jgi:predicted DNA-binding transcriptional regulator AlpA